MDQNKIDVKMGEFMVAESPSILQSIGIGSCIVVCIYDRKNKIGGLAHIMSPKSRMESSIKPMRFANTAIKMMLESMRNLGADTEHLTAKLIGGASMFPKVTEILEIGKENALAVKNELKKTGVRVIKEEIGGNTGRSVWFDTSNGDAVVSKIKGETIII